MFLNLLSSNINCISHKMSIHLKTDTFNYFFLKVLRRQKHLKKEPIFYVQFKLHIILNTSMHVILESSLIIGVHNTQFIKCMNIHVRKYVRNSGFKRSNLKKKEKIQIEPVKR